MEAAEAAEEAKVVAGKTGPYSVSPGAENDDTDTNYPRIEPAESPGSSGTMCRHHMGESIPTS